MPLLLYCRAGFEGECAAEISACAAELGCAGYARAAPGTGWVVYELHEVGADARVHARLALHALVFVRQWFVVLARLDGLIPDDRVTPMAAAFEALPAPVEDVWIETPDTNEAKEWTGLARALTRPLHAALEATGRLTSNTATGWRAHVCLLSSTTAYVGYASVSNSSPWPGGVPRLKFPRGAPSRSTLKLDEAFLEFLSEVERAKFLQPGMSAVDLGAAPGGWTYQLVRRHLRVIAVDNGAMDAALLESGVVEHVRADGFGYRPAKPVDWMVCDIVEQPIRIARLAAQWLAQGWCKHSIFNLKLPMKKRYQEVRRCLDEIHAELDAAGMRHRVQCKQLYHDREEVTVYLMRL